MFPVFSIPFITILTWVILTLETEYLFLYGTLVFHLVFELSINIKLEVRH